MENRLRVRNDQLEDDVLQDLNELFFDSHGLDLDSYELRHHYNAVLKNVRPFINHLMYSGLASMLRTLVVKKICEDYNL